LTELRAPAAMLLSDWQKLAGCGMFRWYGHGDPSCLPETIRKKCGVSSGLNMHEAVMEALWGVIR
jgi:hypothetical protein